MEDVLGALITELSKEFDRLPRDLIIAKLNSYGFNVSIPKFIRNYLPKKELKLSIGITHGRIYSLEFLLVQY